MTLLEIFRNPGALAEMPLPDKILGVIQITVIGMALTFVALVLVWLTVRLLTRLTAGSPGRELKPIPLPRPARIEDDGEKVAAIAAVLALLEESSPDRIRVKKIVRGPHGGSRWADWER
jgi:glutaconyl-CoA/methylmalonyl-CoA decarboxylase subunit delta